MPRKVIQGLLDGLTKLHELEVGSPKKSASGKSLDALPQAGIPIVDV